MLGKGGSSELTRRADKRDGREVARSVLVEILHFLRQDRRSAGYTGPIRESRVSHDSLGRILLGDVLDSP